MIFSKIYVVTTRFFYKRYIELNEEKCLKGSSTYFHGTTWFSLFCFKTAEYYSFGLLNTKMLSINLAQRDPEIEIREIFVIGKNSNNDKCMVFSRLHRIFKKIGSSIRSDCNRLIFRGPSSLQSFC